MTAESAQAMIHRSPTRCPVCQESIETSGESWLACANCLSRHHQGCWQRSGSCGDCGLSQALRVESSAASEKQTAGSRAELALELRPLRPSSGPDSTLEQGRHRLLRPAVAVALSLMALSLLSLLAQAPYEASLDWVFRWLPGLLQIAGNGALIYATIKSRGWSQKLGVLALFLIFLPRIVGTLMYSESWSILRQVVYYIAPSAVQRMFDGIYVFLLLQGFALLGLIFVFFSLSRFPVLEIGETDSPPGPPGEASSSGKDAESY